jgi:hypothetical protein
MEESIQSEGIEVELISRRVIGIIEEVKTGLLLPMAECLELIVGKPFGNQVSEHTQKAAIGIDVELIDRVHVVILGPPIKIDAHFECGITMTNSVKLIDSDGPAKISPMLCGAFAHSDNSDFRGFNDPNVFSRKAAFE